MSKRSRISLLLGFALVGLVAAVTAKPHFPEVNPQRDNLAMTAKTEDTRAELMTLKTVLSAKQKLSNQRDIQLDSAGADNQELAVEQEHISPNRQREIQDRELEEKIAAFEAHLAQEGLDPTKTDRQSERIEQRLREDGLAEMTTLVSLRCSSSLCRAELVHDNVEYRNEFRRLTLDKTPFDGQLFGSFFEDDGVVESAVYYSNPGGTLPPIHPHQQLASNEVRSVHQ